jgi:TPR repeat protein
VEKNLSIAFNYFMDTVYGAQIDGYMAKAYKRFREGDKKGSYLYYIMASSLGYQSARTSLAYFFEKGLNLNKCWLGKELCLANYLIRAITENGDKWANEKLAKLLYTGGEFLKANFSEAYLFYQNAPKTGEVLFTLGYLNEHGLGCSQNLTAAECCYLEIISLADGKKIEQASKYPALIALYKLRFKASLKYFFELIQFNWVY